MIFKHKATVELSDIARLHRRCVERFGKPSSPESSEGKWAWEITTTGLFVFSFASRNDSKEFLTIQRGKNEKVGRNFGNDGIVSSISNDS